MMTAISPTGIAITYNDATYVTRSANGYSDLYTKKDGTWIAQVPHYWLIEAQTACQARNRSQDGALQSLVSQVLQLGKEIRSLKRKVEAFGK